MRGIPRMRDSVLSGIENALREVCSNAPAIFPVTTQLLLHRHTHIVCYTHHTHHTPPWFINVEQLSTLTPRRQLELFLTWAADVLEGGEVVEDLVPLHVGPHLGKQQQVSWCTRRGRMALHKLWTSTKGEFVVTQWHGQAWTQSTENRLLKVKQAAGFCFTICCWLRKGDKGVKFKCSMFGGKHPRKSICSRELSKWPITRFSNSQIFSASWTNANIFPPKVTIHNMTNLPPLWTRWLETLTNWFPSLWSEKFSPCSRTLARLEIPL